MTWAVLDWGIGGCGLYKLLKARNPARPLIYWSDSGFTPYGKVPRRDLKRRLEAVLRELARRGATHVVVACNAASTVLDDVTMAGRHGLEVTGVIDPTVASFRRGPKLKLGVIGGGRTVRSDVYGRALRALGHEVRQRAAQPLSAFVEAGELASPRVARAIDHILAPLGEVDALILACTHYPALAPLFGASMPGTPLVDPALLTQGWIQQHWQDSGSGVATRPHQGGLDLVLTTGAVRSMKAAAAAAFDVHFDAIHRIPVDFNDSINFKESI